MAKSYPVRNSFNAGEISTLVSFRDDIQKYSSACLTLENAVPLVEGGAKKMPGTYFAGATANGGCMFTGSISGTTLTVTNVNYGVLQLGQTVIGAGVAAGTVLTLAGAAGGTQYTPSQSTGSIVTVATSVNTNNSASKNLSGFASVGATYATLTVYVKVVLPSGSAGAGSAQLLYSINSGATWIVANSWSSNYTGTVTIPITGITNLNTVQLQLAVSAEVGSGIHTLPATASLNVTSWFANTSSSGATTGTTGVGGVGIYTVSVSQNVSSELMQTAAIGKSRLVPFQYSTIQGAILEFSAGIVRIWEGASQGSWAIGLALQVPANASNYNPATQYFPGTVALLGPYAFALFYSASGATYVPNPSLGVLSFAAPYGASYVAPVSIVISTNTSDVLNVTKTGSSPYQNISIALANTTSANNAASAIQAAIRSLGSLNAQANNYVDLNGWTVTPDPIYAATPWTTAPTNAPGVAVGAADSVIVQALLAFGSTHFPILYTGAYNQNYWKPYSSAAQLPIEVTTPYLEGDLFALDCSTQSADVLWVFHPNYPPAVIERLGPNSWQYSLSFPGQSATQPPYRGTLDVVKTGYSALGQTIAGINPTGNYVGLSFGSPTPAPFANGDRIYINECSGFAQLNEGEFIVSGIQIAAGSPYNWQFNLLDPDTRNLIVFSNILPYTGGGFAVKVVPLYATAGDYPACGTLYQQRLCVGGSDNNPTQISGSVEDDYTNFICDPNEDDYGIQFTLVSTQVNQLLNMIPTPNALLIGTSGGVWVLQGSSNGSLSQTNVSAAVQTTQGVAQLQPQLVNGSAIFVSRSARIVSFLVYSFTTNEWESNDLTRLNRTITLGPSYAQSGIAQTAFMIEPYPVFWAVRNDGQLLGLVFNTQDQVYAWFRINMTAEGGTIESCAVVSGANQEDQLVVVVLRTINGVLQRFVEYFMPQELFSQLSNAFFVHCGQQWSGGPAAAITGITTANPCVVTAPLHGFSNGMTVQITGVLGMNQINQDAISAYTVSNATANTFQLVGMNSSLFNPYISGGSVAQVANQVTGMSYLLGNMVTAVGDGAVILPPTLVTSDIVTFPYYANLITIGVPYTTTVQPTNPVMSSQAATTRGMPQKLNRVSLSVYQSMGGNFGQDLNHMYPMHYGTGTMDKTPTMTTTLVTEDMDDDWSETSTFYVTQADPLPFTLRGIIFRMSVTPD